MQTAAIETDDMTISAAIRSGNEQVFGQVFRRWYTALCTYALSFTGNDPDEAEELVQQVFLNIWEHRERFPNVVSVKAYLYRAVHNSGLNLIEKQKRKVSIDDSPLHVAHLREEHTSGLQVQELELAIGDAVDRLPIQCRRVFELSRYEQMKYKEIADVMNISVKTVENQMGKALRILRGRLAPFLPLLVLSTLIRIIFREP
jgi:RNA polymerase sigma-70 factor (ECF subfamily)